MRTGLRPVRAVMVAAALVVASTGVAVAVPQPAGAAGASITSISPAFGPGTGGTLVSIVVRGITIVTSVTFNGAQATVQSVTPLTFTVGPAGARIAVRTPPLPAGGATAAGGAVDVTVSGSASAVALAGASATTVGGFTYTALTYNNNWDCYDPHLDMYQFTSAYESLTTPAPAGVPVASAFSSGFTLQQDVPSYIPANAQVTVQTASAEVLVGDYLDGGIRDNGSFSPFDQTPSAVAVPSTSSGSSPIVVTFPTLSWQAITAGFTDSVVIYRYYLALSWASPNAGSGSTVLDCIDVGATIPLVTLTTTAPTAQASLSVSSPVAPLQDQVTAGCAVGAEIGRAHV